MVTFSKGRQNWNWRNESSGLFSIWYYHICVTKCDNSAVLYL